MALSRKLLALLEVLDYPEIRIDYLMEHFQGMAKDDPPRSSEEERVQDEACRKLIRALTSCIVRERMEPTREMMAPPLKEYLQDSGDIGERLDAHFTVLELVRVSGAVRRWNELKPLQLALLPQDEVANYVRQASECYVYGMPTASTILCRAVLEASLEEKLGSLGGIKAGGSLFDLIEIAKKEGILSSLLGHKAHKIRKAGRDAVHKTPCAETEALDVIRDLTEVLTHLYGTPSRKA